MIRYLVDSSAIWRITRDDALADRWFGMLTAGAVGSCAPQRAEFRRSARNSVEYDQINELFFEMYPDVPVPKAVWSWIESAQHRLVGVGAVRALSTVDLLICATAAARGLVILHDDADFELAEWNLPDVRAQRVVSPAGD
ncbi:PIN domain-containing protein [Tsukamurella pseudospumae]|uniref:Ribonuclease VapC n=1 Tax=Tsukamurella pseudospumae TaxID=239498 RepID=A0A138A0W9_9ACTN|nr:PIN domain-containing protein [Tsukamurella pseudospumae]KXO88844.1 ribonuclease [Tsukamurella pseudospumae]KXP04072.1 ribonuclease [Tsukamurella pseudospumae]